MVRIFRQHRQLLALILLFTLALAIAACGRTFPQPTASLPPGKTATASPTLFLSATASPTSSLTPTPPGQASIWENFPRPLLTPSTPIPPPLTGLVVPEEVRVLAIAGVDRELPYSGRTDAIALVIYHPRLARASLVSVPPDLFGYIPGYTMQRMNTAYSIGGPRMLSDTLAYNFGLRPDQYAVFNLDSFSHLIDDLGGINVTVLENIRAFCPDIPPGLTLMNGEQTLCYMRLRLGEDELSRNRRQQEILRTVFLRLVEGGNLVRVPELYNSYRSSIDSNLTLEGIMEAMPLAIKLGDPNRIGYFQLEEAHLHTWEISDQPKANVFLPNRPALMRLMQQAINYVTTPSPLSDMVMTIEYELTISPTPTNTYTPTPIPTSTQTSTPTQTPTITPTFTPTVTNTRTPTLIFTPTRTWTPTATRTTVPVP